MSIAASVARGRDARSRSLIWLSILTLVGSLLIVGAARPDPALGAPGGNTVTFGVAIAPASPTAGTAFTVTVTAQDSRGRTVNSFFGPATLSGLANAPYGQAPTYGQLLVWDGGVSSTTAIATRSQAGAKVTASAVIDGVTVTGQSAAFAVQPSGATSIAFADVANGFDGQPVDTETGLPIKSSLTTNDPVKVIALDQYGNRVSGVGVTVGSSPAGAGPTTVNTASGTPGQSPYGEASFGSLSITAYGDYVLDATAAGALADTSDSFEIVADLANCSGNACSSKGKSAGTNLQITYSSLTGVTTFSNVTLTTSFIGNATDAGCTGAGDAFGELSEVRVQGAGVTTVQPDFQLAMIIPKATLQSFALTSRAADSFNICLGAVRLDGGTGGWHGRAAIGGPIVELPATSGIYWGWVADCGTAGVVDGEDPCVSLKTKNAGALQAELGMTKGEFKDLGFASSDLALVIEKPYPWDGKTIFK